MDINQGVVVGMIKDMLTKYMLGIPTEKEVDDMTRTYQDRIANSQSKQDAEKFRDMKEAEEKESFLEKKRLEERLKRQAIAEAEKQYFMEEDKKRQLEADKIIKELEKKDKESRIERQLREKGYYQKEEPEIDPLVGPNAEEYEEMMKKKLGYYSN